MSSSLSGRVARTLRVLVVVFAGGWGVVGCTGSGERLPQCKGRAQPINTGPINPLSPRLVEGPVTQVPVTQVPVRARGVTDAH